MTHVYKIHTKKSEPYSPRKLARSVMASCLCVRTPIGEARVTAEEISHHMAKWLAHKEEVTSHDLRVHAARYLSTYNPDAAYILKNDYTK
ncbi:MAG TPA: hypothetical protein VGS28_04375 [Candidatus Saccharimonadales bacterium]|nr:hypothetical protein [Candidatus Saccharimonadales bacterium]